MFSDKDIAHFSKLETPFYYYDLNLLEQTIKACSEAAEGHRFHVHYAMKANFNEMVLGKIKAIGFGADCVSGGEVKKAIEVGFAKEQIVFAGVGKSDREIIDALESDIFCFNVESLQELEVINELAEARQKIAKVAIRINPNVDAHTHANITTGLDENKFGINSWDMPACAALLNISSNLEFIGIHFHIGSQITNLDVYKNLCNRVNEFSAWFEDHGFKVKVLNVGGGLGIDYHHPNQQIPDFSTYFKVFSDFLTIKPYQEVHFEIGRALELQAEDARRRDAQIEEQNRLITQLIARMNEQQTPQGQLDPEPQAHRPEQPGGQGEHVPNMNRNPDGQNV
ncbi:MAG: hypothetical protein EOP48_14540, partial [Sphingobacteriales bacterium]